MGCRSDGGRAESDSLASCESGELTESTALGWLLANEPLALDVSVPDESLAAAKSEANEEMAFDRDSAKDENESAKLVAELLELFDVDVKTFWLFDVDVKTF